MSDVTNSGPVLVEEEARTFTVREMIAALAQCENMDATVCVQLPALKHEPIEATAVDYDPENEQYIVFA